MKNELSELQKAAIIAYAESGMNSAQAAASTGYHPESLMYHLRNVRKATGLNYTNFFDLIHLYQMATGDSLIEEYRKSLCVALEAMKEAERIRAKLEDALADIECAAD